MMRMAVGVRRAVLAAAVAISGWILTATPASATPEYDVPGSQAPPWLTWIGLEDTRGISVWLYELSLDRGGITSPDKFFWSSITDLCWSAYRAVCAMALWFLDWVLSFTWVTTLASPLLAVGDALQSVVSSIGVIPTLLTITAIVAVLLMARGKWATGIWELGIALVIAALATGVFAQPVQMIAGPDGVIVQTNQAGQQLAAELATGEAAGKTPDELRREQIGQMVDTFIRQPTQLINFGRVVDGGECEANFNEVVAAGPYGNDSDIRDRMGDCDSALRDYANEPTAAMAWGALMVMPAAFVILVLTVALAGAVVVAGCWAMYQAVKAIITLVLGLLPGGGRGSLLLTISEILVSLLIILFTSVFLGVFLLVIQAVFAGAAGESLGKTFFIVDIIIIIGVFVYWRQRNAIRAASKRLAAMMAKRPGGAQATKLPERAPGISMAPLSSAANTAASLGHLRAQRRAVQNPASSGPSFVDARQQVAFIGVTPRQQGPQPPPHYDAHFGPNPGPRTGAPAPAGALPGGGGAAKALPPGNGGGAKALPPGGPDPSGPAGALPGGGGTAKALPPGNSDPSGPGGSPRSRLMLQQTKKAAGTLARAGTQVALAASTGGAGTVAAGASKAATAGRVVNTARRAALTAQITAGRGRDGDPKPTGPMRSRTQPSPPPGRTQARSPGASAAVVTGEVVASKLAGEGEQKASKAAGSSTGTSADAGKPPVSRQATVARPESPRSSSTPAPSRPQAGAVRSEAGVGRGAGAGEVTVLRPGIGVGKGAGAGEVTVLKVAHAAKRNHTDERETPSQEPLDRLKERLSRRGRRSRTGRSA